MASHLWNVKKFSPHVVAEAVETFEEALNVVGSDVAIGLTGYVLESIRQSGRGSPPRRIIQGAIKSGHRYSRGINALNYQIAGAKLLAAAFRKQIVLGSEGEAVLRSFEESGDVTPLSIFLDYLDDNGIADPTELKGLIRLAQVAPHLQEGS